MAEEITTSEEALVGNEDGEKVATGETVIYDYDEDGQFVGWHKEPKAQEAKAK